jgi:hypothetical protein
MEEMTRSVYGGKTMQKTTREHVTRFQKDHGVCLDTRNLESYWVITARIPKNLESLHHVHYARKFIASRNEGGSVLIITNPQVSDNYAVENWGEMDSFDNFVEKALAQILADKIAMDTQETGECGAGCA